MLEYYCFLYSFIFLILFNHTCLFYVVCGTSRSFSCYSELLTVPLLNCRYTIVSTGGTASALEKTGVAVTKVEQLTQFPEMVCALLLEFSSISHEKF